MKTAVGCRASVPFGRWGAGLLIAVLCLATAPASSSDYQLDEADRAPKPLQLPPSAERKADAMAHFLVGVFAEDSRGPEQALASYRETLALDPGFTKLAVEVAYDYLRRGEATDAIGVLKDAFKARPDDPEPALALSTIYLRNLRKPDLAARFAEAALKIAPDRFAPYEALWEISTAQNDAAGASRAIARAMKSPATAPGYWLQLADFLTNSGDGDNFRLTDEIKQQLGLCLSRAAVGATADASSLARIADFHALCRQFEDAAIYYAKAAELRPALPNINERLAGVLLELGRKDDAIPVLERIIAANSLDVTAYDQLYRLYEQKGDLPRAIKNLEQAIIIDRTNLARQRDLMVLLLQAGRFGEAATRAAEAGKLFPRIPLFAYVEARALAAERRYDASLAAFERAAIQAAADDNSILNASFYFDFGSTAQMAGRTVKAAELFRRAIELDPANPDPYNALGYMWIERGEHLDEAERLVRKALTLQPQNGAFIDSLGWLYYQRGQYEQALAELLRAAAALPEPDPVVHEHIGDAYRALNRVAEALFHWQKAAALDPANKALAAKIEVAVSQVAEKKP